MGRALAFAVGVALLVLLGRMHETAPDVVACSVGPDFDPVGAADVIVGGLITDWELIEDATVPDWKKDQDYNDDPDYYGPYDAIKLQMQVDRVYKGSVPVDLEMVSGNTYQNGHWVGSSGACGAFDFDPTGKYWILGLIRDDFGRLHPGLPGLFYWGTELPDEQNSARLQQTGLSDWSFPVAGPVPREEEHEEEDLPSVPIVILAFLIPAAVLLIPSFLGKKGSGGH
jgi:hypothetical protein